ncbi:MAG: SUMF1/EgtB/PvdO family nonheme iron enzyme, partial [Roseimicrobium sp.]
LARRLGFFGHAFHALNPCPRDRWQPQMAAHWPSAVWDRRPRLPRRGGLKVKQTLLSAPAEGTEGQGAEGQTGVSASLSATDRLLTLLSPASRIEAPLLRTARLALGHAADAGTEWDAWHHEQCWHSLDCFGFHPGADYEARLNQRQALTGREASLAAAIGGLMAAHHAGCSSVIAAEASLRAILSSQKETPREVGKPQRSESEASSLRFSNLCGVKTLLQSVVDRLRLLAADPGSEEGRQSGLPGWFPGMVDRLSAPMRADVEVKKLIAEGLAYAHTCLETEHTELPPGVDGEVFQRAKAEVAEALPELVRGRVELAQGGWQFTPQDLPPQKNWLPLCDLQAARPPLHLTLEPGTRHSYRLATPPVAVSLPALPVPQALVLESDLERVHFQPLERPSWARKMWHDATGLAAVFHIRSIPFILRWIPPGSFLMGSPEDEPGRQRNEGPQHRVTISQGYWMADTPVTQAQWRAVVEAGRADAPLWRRLFGKKDALKPAPSQFQGPPELPVESVNWQDCTAFCRLLDALLPNGPGFHLPTEAQWEYACRAGTEPQVPFHGPIRLEGDVLSPDLEAYAWYGGNSGKDCVVSNPQDSSSWLGKGSGSPTAGTHPVKRKLPNRHGLHDMLGNVWEWCADACDEEVYAKRAGGAKDPRNDSTDDSAGRVMRGGSWNARALICRAAYRDGFHSGSRWYYQGLRLAAGQEPGSAEQPLPERRSRG